MDIITSPPQPTNQPPSPATSSNSTAAQTPPLTPPPVSRSDPHPHPHPTTFVQADTTSFKQVVQMLTGSSNPTHHPDPTPTPSKSTSIPPVKTGQQKKYKLYERRNSLKTGLLINPSHSGHGLSSPRVHELLSPSILDFPALTLSPVTPLIQDRFNNTNDNNNKSSPSVSEEERVIKEKGFYLHPSPRAVTPRGAAEPQLLPLFPVASPRASELSS
ncbi:putative VQ motif-containing protein/13/19/31/33 [Helianthus anomalus]